MIKVAYVMITILCDGHTNAECIPAITRYDSMQECTDRLVIPAHKGFWGQDVKPEIIKNAICIGTIQ